MNPKDMPGQPDNRALEAEVRRALAWVRKDQFETGFEDRALARWNRERFAAPSTFALIERRAWQFLPIAIAASLLLAVYSARHHDSSASFVARSLGWSNQLAAVSATPTYESVYATLYGLPELNSIQGVR